MNWRELFSFPFRRPSILLKLWLIHLAPMLALIPFVVSGAITMLGGAVNAYRHSPGFLDGAVAAMGLGTAICYLFFIAVAIFCAMYPLGYLLDVARAVAREEIPQALPLGRWLPRFGLGFYAFLLVYPGATLVVLPALALPAAGLAAVLNQLKPYLASHHEIAVLLIIALQVLAVALSTSLVMFAATGIWLRLGRSLNPFWVLNPLGILGDFGRGWRDYVAVVLVCLTGLMILWLASLGLMLFAPFFFGGLLIIIPSLLLGLAQNYFLLLSAQAGGRYARLYLR